MARVLITGANRGIGLAFARAFGERGDEVVGSARRPDEATELRACGARVEELDVTDDASVEALARRLEGLAIDLLVHNAGLLVDDALEDVEPADVLRQMDVNVVGPLRVTRALLPGLQRADDPRIVALSSVMSSIAENEDGGYYGYRVSKAALNAVAKSLALDLDPIPVVLLHPGYVKTRMTGGKGNLTPEQSVARLLPLIDRIDASMSGTFIDVRGRTIPW